MTAVVEAPPRFPEVLPRGGQLWDPARSGWTRETTSGIDACDLIEAYLRLTKGPQRGQLVRLRHWQGDLLCDVLRVDPFTSLRVHRTYLALLPRKNSKSLLGSGLAIDGLVDEPGAEVYSCAADKDQAKIVFKEVKDAVEMSDDLDGKRGGLFKVYRDAIEYPATGSVYRALSSEAFTKEGLNPSRVIFDELHAQPNWELWNVMNQGSDARTAPLVVAISTFGVRSDTLGQDTVCYAQYLYVKKLMAGELDDPSYGGRIYETNDRVADFDYLDEKHWHDANPALGDFLVLDHMRSTSRKMPENDFKTKRLNIWTSKTTAWLPAGTWEATTADRAIPAGAPVFLGFDGSFSNDSTALVVWWMDEIPHLDLVRLWERRDSDDPAWRVPILEVEEEIRQACRRWTVEEIVCDPARWARSYQILEDEGLPVVEFPQSPQRMVPATQRMFEALINKTVTHSNHPALARHFDNAVIRNNGRGWMVSKDPGQSQRKIDAAPAAIMALDELYRRSEQAEPRFYSFAELDREEEANAAAAARDDGPDPFAARP